MLSGSIMHHRDAAPAEEIFVQARMPLCIAPGMVRPAFLVPLARALEKARLGRVTGHEVTRDDMGEPVALRITMTLSTLAGGALDHVAEQLDALDAPRGSTIGTALRPELRRFGRSEGLGLYLARCDADAAGRLDVVEACTDALDGSGLYQGSCEVGDHVALYFYGDGFDDMNTAVAGVMAGNPHCRNAYVRRLT